MNEKISEIKKQSYVTSSKKVLKGGWDNDRPPYEYETILETNFSEEKFAELLIEKCANIASELQNSLVSNEESKLDIALGIKEYFGLNEKKRKRAKPIKIEIKITPEDYKKILKKIKNE